MARSVLNSTLRKIRERLTVGAIPFLATAGGEENLTPGRVDIDTNQNQTSQGGGGGLSKKSYRDDWFDAGVFCLAHPEKIHKNPDPHNELKAFGAGEDSAFVVEPHELSEQTSLFFGVCDGVGGWARDPRAKPELYSRLICHFSKERIIRDDDPGQIDLREVMNDAHMKMPVELLGSTTAMLIKIRKTGLLTSANLGDCSYIILRNDEPIGHASVTTKSFNFPFQLGPRGTPGDTAYDSVEETIQLHEGDIIVAGSDGVWDNIFDDEIAEIFVEMKGAPLDEIARRIGIRSRELENREHSPFAVRARQEGSRWHSGGKLDDTTVVCLRYKGTDGDPKEPKIASKL